MAGPDSERARHSAKQNVVVRRLRKIADAGGTIVKLKSYKYVGGSPMTKLLFLLSLWLVPNIVLFVWLI